MLYSIGVDKDSLIWPEIPGNTIKKKKKRYDIKLKSHCTAKETTKSEETTYILVEITCKQYIK
jgi:hypothetical protein